MTRLWIDCTEQELAALLQRQVLDSMREKAREMLTNLYQDEFAAASYTKHSRRNKTTRSTESEPTHTASNGKETRCL